MAGDKDIQSLVLSSVDSLSDLRSLDEGHKKVIETWLFTQLEQERKGWKEKLQMSMKEIERERKMAAEVHGEIDKLNSKFVLFEEVMGLTRQPSMYMNAEHDHKVYSIDRLHRNIDAILNLIQHYSMQLSSYAAKEEGHSTGQEDSSEGQKHFDTELAVFPKQLWEFEKEAKEMEERLSKEIRNLQEAMDIQDKVFKSEKEKHSKQIEELQGIISHQRVKLTQFKERKQSRMSIWSKAVQVDIAPETRECCIQIGDPMPGTFSSRTSDSDQTPYTSHEKRENKPDNKNSDPKLAREKTIQPAKSELLDISDTKVFIQNQPSLRKTKSMTTLTGRGAYQSVVVANEVLATQHENIKMWLDSVQNAEVTDHKNMVEHLLKQVTEFGQKLEKAKKDMEMCQRQMAWLTGRDGTFVELSQIREPLIERELKRLKKLPNGTSLSLNNLPKEVQSCAAGLQNMKAGSARQASIGYLGSVKLHNCLRHVSPGAEKELVLKLRSMNPKHSDSSSNGSEPRSATNSTLKAKCLRCHKVYRVKEERHQCRYHPKTKRKIERYDARDRMVRMTYLWECCLQSQDAPGCCVGEHI